MKRQVKGVGVGTVSLVMIFAVLCLTVFSMLTLTTSMAEKIMSEKTSTFVKGYYEADAQATQIRAQVIALADRGLIPGAIGGIEIVTETVQGQAMVSYSCTISDVQELFVRFEIDHIENNVLNWQIQSTGEWEADNSLNVWDGTFE